MKIEQCAFISNETLSGTPSCGTCNLFPKEELRNSRFIPCETIPISKCPYKRFISGLITKVELNDEVKRLTNNKIQAKELDNNKISAS